MEKLEHLESQIKVSDEVEERFKYYLEYFSLTEEDLQKPLLDVGVNKGYFVKYIRDVIGNKQAYGIEKYPSKIDQSNDGIVAGDGLIIPFRDDTFEIVVAKNYLPMFVTKAEEMETAFLELLRVTKSGGKIMADISTPEKELAKAQPEDSSSHRKWLEARYEGSKKFKSFLEKQTADGLSIQFKDVYFKKDGDDLHAVIMHVEKP